MYIFDFFIFKFFGILSWSAVWGVEPVLPFTMQLPNFLRNTYYRVIFPYWFVLPSFQSVQSFNCSWLFVTLWTVALQASLSITSSWSNSCPSSQWCCPTISSSVIPFSCLQSFPESGFPSESVLHIRWPKY